MENEHLSIEISPNVDKSRRFVFDDTIWLGGKHDGYSPAEFNDYCRYRVLGEESFKTPQERAALRQCQFTFGLLETVTERPVNESQLLKVVDGKTYLTDENIFGLMVDWHRDIRSVTDEHQNHSWARKTVSTLDEMHSRLLRDTIHEAFAPINYEALNLLPNDLYLIVASCAAIAEIVHVTARTSFLPGSALEQREWSWTFVQTQSLYQTNKMISRGWCPLLARMLSHVGVTAYNYASTQEATAEVQNKSGLHSGCTDHMCNVNVIDAQTHETKHVQPKCTCEFRSPQIDHIRALLLNGRIPVVVYDPSHPNIIDVQPSDELPFIAISHVWVDGLGSNSETGLPICQLKKLAESVKQLLGTRTGAFWIDSLCVPKEERAIGLATRARVYQGATMTLVIDSGIRTASLKLSKAGRTLRIITSNWMRDLWTLQEAWWAKNLVFEFQDGFAKAAGDELMPQNEDWIDVTLSRLHLAARSILTTSRSTIDLCAVAEALAWRSAGEAGDEAVAIAGLLGVDAAKVAAEPQGEKRMMKLFTEISAIPQDIIFLGGSKLTEAGFRWAPLTMMSAERSEMKSTDLAVCLNDGLSANYATVYTSESLVVDTQYSYVLRDERRDRAFHLINTEHIEPGRTFDRILMDALPEDPPKNGMGPFACVAAKNMEVEADGRLVCEYVGKFSVLVQRLGEVDFDLRLGVPLIKSTSAETETLDIRLT